MVTLFQSLSSIFSEPSLKMADRQKSDGSEATQEVGARGAKDAAPLAPPLEISSEILLAGRSEIRIRHRGEIYRLTLTRAGKLILHK
jgi:hemin uptake protein HemP